MGYRVWGLGLILLACSCGTHEKKMELSEADSAVATVENTSQPKEAAKPVDTTSIFGAYVGQFIAEKYHEEKNISYLNLRPAIWS
jgi:hypothetical protein